MLYDYKTMYSFLCKLLVLKCIFSFSAGCVQFIFGKIKFMYINFKLGLNLKFDCTLILFLLYMLLKQLLMVINYLYETILTFIASLWQIDKQACSSFVLTVKFCVPPCFINESSCFNSLISKSL